MDHCIIYFSYSVWLYQEEDLVTILQQSRQNNRNLGITGVLLYVKGSIIQVLEGEKNTVEALYRRIEKDERHTGVSKALNRQISQRLFGDWAMGYETLLIRQLEDIKTIVNLESKKESAVEPHDSLILKTIKLFYDSNRYN